MPRFVVLQPVSAIAKRLTDGEDIATLPGETLLPDGSRCGALCPICGVVMGPVIKGNAQIVACVTDTCVYFRVPFRSSIPVEEVRHEPVGEPL